MIKLHTNHGTIALELDAEYGIAIHNLALTYAKMGMYQEAIRLNPDGPEGHNNLGAALGPHPPSRSLPNSPSLLLLN